MQLPPLLLFFSLPPPGLSPDSAPILLPPSFSIEYPRGEKTGTVKAPPSLFFPFSVPSRKTAERPRTFPFFPPFPPELPQHAVEAGKSFPFSLFLGSAEQNGRWFPEPFPFFPRPIAGCTGARSVSMKGSFSSAWWRFSATVRGRFFSFPFPSSPDRGTLSKKVTWDDGKGVFFSLSLPAAVRRFFQNPFSFFPFCPPLRKDRERTFSLFPSPPPSFHLSFSSLATG